MKRVGFLFLIYFLFSLKGFALTNCSDDISIDDLRASQYQNEETELSKEYLPEKDPKGIFLVVHGLNLKPSKMTAFSQYLLDKGYYVLRVSLEGHRGSLEEQKKIQWKNWMEDMQKHYCYALKQSKKFKAPLYNLSFSLGSLVSMGHISLLKENPYEKEIFLAPATWIHWYGKIPGWLGFLDGEVGLPSKNLEEYRSQPTTSLNCYRAMKEGREFLENASPEVFKVPTLIIMDKKDELVSIKKIEKYSHKNKLENLWSFFTVTNKETELEKSYHHLIVDQKSLGGKQWNKLLERLSAFLEEE